MTNFDFDEWMEVGTHLVEIDSFFLIFVTVWNLVKVIRGVSHAEC